MLSRISAWDLLDSIDGVAYLVDPQGIIEAVGVSGWTKFATENDAPELTASRVIGSDLFSMIAGDDTRDMAQRMHAAVSHGRRPIVAYEYRCDSPGMRRDMRMSMHRVPQTGDAVGVLYQSQVLDARPRPAIALFSAEAFARSVGDAAHAHPIVLCSYCQQVAWPIDADQDKRIWIEPEEYYRRGGETDLAISHGICPSCWSETVEPNI